MSYLEPTAEQPAPPDLVGDPAQQVEEPAKVDLQLIARDLADAEVALARLDAGTYWTSEISGAELPDELLTASPATRRLTEE